MLPRNAASIQTFYIQINASNERILSIQKNCKLKIAIDHLQFFKVYNVK